MLTGGIKSDWKKNLEDGAGAWDMKSLAKKEKGKMENCQCLQEATAQ